MFAALADKYKCPDGAQVESLRALFYSMSRATNAADLCAILGAVKDILHVEFADPLEQ